MRPPLHLRLLRRHRWRHSVRDGNRLASRRRSRIRQAFPRDRRVDHVGVRRGVPSVLVVVGRRRWRPARRRRCRALLLLLVPPALRVAVVGLRWGLPQRDCRDHPRKGRDRRAALRAVVRIGLSDHRSRRRAARGVCSGISGADHRRVDLLETRHKALGDRSRRVGRRGSPRRICR